jgi:hypothetical protein
MNSSNGQNKYVLDTNILIGFSIWTPICFHNEFWSKLENCLQEGKWILLDVVVKEVKYNKDLEAWCKKQTGKGLVKDITDDHRNRAAEINNKYPMIDEATQNSVTDPYIIAYAEANKLGIVTREVHKEADSLYKIPDVCGKLNIEVIKKPEDFLRKINFS